MSHEHALHAHDPDDEHEHPSRIAHFRVAFFLVSILVVGMVVTLPFAMRSLIHDLYNSVEGDIYPFGGFSARENPGARNRVHVSIVGLDEAKLTLTLRVSGHRTCPSPCSAGNRIVFFALGTDEAATAGMPPSGSIDLLNSQQVVTTNIDLPVHGHPTLYPFDVYELWLGVGVGEIGSDQSVRPLTREEASGLLALTLQEQLSREELQPPVDEPPVYSPGVDDPYQLQGLERMRFARPVYERVLAVFLVLLVAAAAAYAVFMRPLHDLVMNSGGLVLGVWGIRSLLTPGTASHTLVELTLSMVILFLLGAITFRALQYLHLRGRIPHWRKRPQPNADSAIVCPPDCEHRTEKEPVATSAR